MPRSPRLVPFLVVLCSAVTVTFLATGPWPRPFAIARFENIAAVWVVAALVALSHQPSRAVIRAWLQCEARLSRNAAIAAIALVFLFLMRLIAARYLALEVNAWDFSLSFDRPIERTLHGEFLWSPDLGRPALGTHCNWIVLAFVPLYAIVASPWWLIAGQAAAITAAVVALFWLTRTVSGDDFLSACVTLAFLLNRYTARAAQFVFVADVFYPAALFLLYLAFIRKKPWLFITALFVTLAIKEDAVLPLAGFAIVAGLEYRRWRWAAATVAIAGTVFVFDYCFVLPGFGRSAVPWYANYWASYGADPLSAIGGMLASPLHVARRVITGTFDFFGCLAFAPLAGRPWIIAVIPSLIVFGAADADKVHYLTLHYSLPLLPAMFASLPFALERIGARFRDVRFARRIAAVVVLVVSALVGSTYELDAPRSERLFIAPLVQRAGDVPLYVQGALLPHAGYARNVLALHHDIQPPRNSAFLLCETCDPYPFTADEHAARIHALRHAAGYQEIREGGLLLFVSQRRR